MIFLRVLPKKISVAPLLGSRRPRFIEPPEPPVPTPLDLAALSSCCTVARILSCGIARSHAKRFRVSSRPRDHHVTLTTALTSCYNTVQTLNRREDKLPQTRDVREWLSTFPFPPIPIYSIPIPSHPIPIFDLFPFPWDSRVGYSHSLPFAFCQC